MSEWVWALVRWVHLVAMAIWLGGQLFLFLVVRPVLRSQLDRPTQTQLTAAFGRRYSPLAWISLIVAILTGFAIGEHRGVAWSALVSFPSAYGTLLIMKMTLVALILLLTLLHGRFIGPQLTELARSPDPRDRQRYRQLLDLSVLISTANLLLTLLIVLLSARLVA
jgi:putative copper resistance protein D